MLNYDINSELQRAIVAWVEDAKASCQEWKQSSIQALEQHHKSLHTLMASAKKRVVDSCNILSLEQAIEAVSEEKKQVLALREFAQGVLLAAEKNFLLPQSAQAYDAAPLLQTELTHIVHEADKKARAFIEETKTVETILDDEMGVLRQSLEKANTVARKRACRSRLR